MDDAEDTEDFRPFALRVESLEEAVRISLQGGVTQDCLFKFSRALKAFEITCDRRLAPPDIQSAFTLWWSIAKPQLPKDADFDEWRLDFEMTFGKTRAALGSNPLEQAIRLADAKPTPPAAARYSSPKLKRLVAVCHQLQSLQGSDPFFIGLRDVMKITGAQSLKQASAWREGLVRDGIMIVVEKGTHKRATRFRLPAPQADSPGE